MELISVIVPVCNALATLPRCAKSVLGQSHTQLELLLVDDGSTDGSEGLCDALALADERVRVIHQKNGGVSTARNAGLVAASGRWVVFVDADDALASHALESALAAQSRHPDRLVVWPFTEQFDALPQAPCGKGEAFGIEKTGWLYLDCRLSMPWNKLFDRQVIETGGLRFDPSYSLGEDLLFCLDYCKAFFAAGGAGFFKLRQPQTFYETTENENSLTQRYRPDYCPLWMELFSRLTGDCEQFFHCPAADLVAIRHSWICTIADGVADLLQRDGGTKRQRRAAASKILALPRLQENCAVLWQARRFSLLGLAIRLRRPRLTAFLARMRWNTPARYNKLEAIGQLLFFTSAAPDPRRTDSFPSLPYGQWPMNFTE